MQATSIDEEQYKYGNLTSFQPTPSYFKLVVSKENNADSSDNTRQFTYDLCSSLQQCLTQFCFNNRGQMMENLWLTWPPVRVGGQYCNEVSQGIKNSNSVTLWLNSAAQCARLWKKKTKQNKYVQQQHILCLWRGYERDDRASCK